MGAASGANAMRQSSIKAGVVVAFAIFTLGVPALALVPMSVNDSSRSVILIQNEENKELWRDLQTGETPPEAAVGNEGQAQAPREWEKATNLIDCEKAGGMWDVPNNRCSEKR
jgi:hypothetical protein